MAYRYRDLFIRPNEADGPTRLELAQQLLKRFPVRFQSIYSFIVLEKGLSPIEFIQTVKAAAQPTQYKRFKILITLVEQQAKAATGVKQEAAQTGDDKALEPALHELLALLNTLTAIPDKFLISAPALYLRFIPRGAYAQFTSIIAGSLDQAWLERVAADSGGAGAAALGGPALTKGTAGPLHGLGTKREYDLISGSYIIDHEQEKRKARTNGN